MRFAGRVALITGGANGIGNATALQLASEGASLVIVDIDRVRLTTLVNDLHDKGSEVLGILEDVLDLIAVRRMVERTIARFKRIDILINNVGGSTVIPRPDKHIEDLTLEEWEQTINFNLRGTFLCTHAIVPLMRQENYGRIVNLSSIVARGDSDMSNTAYATAKAGLRTFTRKVAVELANTGITCNAVAPGITLTERIIALRAQRIASKTNTQEEPNRRRVARPEDQAKVIAFLSSDDAAFISGQTLEVTGGE